MANPGCYPTAAALAILPLARSGWVGGSVVVDAESMDVVEMVLSGRVGQRIVGRLRGLGVRAVDLVTVALGRSTAGTVVRPVRSPAPPVAVGR